MERADTPEGDPVCTGDISCCGWAESGPDPCKGCKLKPGAPETEQKELVTYALSLAGHLERYPQAPDKVTWRDSQIHEAVLAARAEHQQAELEKAKQKRHS